MSVVHPTLKNAIFIFILFSCVGATTLTSGLSLKKHRCPMSTKTADPTIKLAVTVFRHGIRGPYPYPYPNSPYQDYNKYFPEGAMELTKVGKKQMYAIGKRFRQRYKALVGEMYSPYTSYFQGTSLDRTLMSVQLVAHALYPASSYQKWDEDETWQPIPVWTDYGRVDKINLLINPLKYPKYNELRTEAVEKLNSSDISKLYEPLSACTGRALSGPSDLLLVWDSLVYQDLNGLKLPEWAKDYYPEPLRSVNNKVLKTWLADSPEMLTITTGTLVHYIKSNMVAKANKTMTKDQKVLVLGGHDSSLVGLLNAIGNKEPLETSPGAMMVFELHEIDNQHIVKVFYYDAINKDKDFHEIPIPICGTPCTLESFEKNIQSIDTDEWRKQYYVESS